MNKTNRLWLFRILGFAAIVLLVLSFVLPWWSTDILVLGLVDAMIMHPYGVEHYLGDMVTFVEPYLPPIWLTYIAYAYAALAVAALLVSLFIKKEQGRLLMGVVGISFVLYILVATGYLKFTLDQFDMGLTGYSYVDATQGFPYHTGLISRFLRGFYVAWAAAIWTCLLAYFRYKITGESKTEAALPGQQLAEA